MQFPPLLTFYFLLSFYFLCRSSQHAATSADFSCESVDPAAPDLLEDRVRDLAARLASARCRIASVTLRGADVSRASCAALTSALALNRSVTSLDVSSSGFDSQALRGLFAALASNTTLTQLDAADAGFDSACIHALARLLRSNTALAALDLSSRLCDAAADEAATAALAAALLTRGSAMHLTLTRDSFPDWEVDAPTPLHRAAAASEAGGRIRLTWADD